MATILLVDDDPIARRVVEKLIAAEPRLRRLAPRVVHAPDGQKALAVVGAERPDLVITDLFMPGMDGFALCRALRTSPKSDAIPIIVVSGVYKDPTLTAGLTAEFGVAFLPKPLAAAALADAILAALGAPGGDGFPDPAPPAEPTRTAPPSLEMPAVSALPGETGLLSDTSVPRLLFDRAEAGATGTLVLVRGQVRKEIYFREGRAVAADSNLRGEALGTLLCAKGIIDDQQLGFLLAEAKKRGEKMGALLVELGWMSPEEVLGCLAAQARKRIGDSVRFADGTWSFLPGDTFGERVIEHDIDLPKVVFTALLRTASPETLVARFDDEGPRPVRLSDRFAAHRETFEAVFGAELPALLTEAPTLGSVILRQDVELLLVGIEALLLSGLGTLDAPRSEPVAERPESWESSFSLERLGNEASLKFQAMQHQPADELFAEGPHAVAPAIAGARAGGAVPRGVTNGDSGVLDTAPRPRTNAGVGSSPGVPRPPQAADEAARHQVLRAYLDVHGKPPHEVLGVPADADAETAKRACDEKLAGISDEALGAADLGPDTPKLEAVRSAYRRALEALSSPRRADDARSRPPAADPIGAELAFGEGLAALAAGRAHEAVARFEAAVRGRPDQALYHAFLGWAAFVADGLTAASEAKDRLQHALALDPDLGKAHELLGKLAVATSDHMMARFHLERALEADPLQTDTLELLFATHARTGDPRGAERCYRKLVAAIGDRAVPLRQRLWRELAELYDKRLSDPESARVAYALAAQRMAGDRGGEPRAPETPSSNGPEAWREPARELGRQWQLDPENGQRGERLLDHLLRAGREDAATVVAAALLLRGGASERVTRLAADGRPTVLRRIAQPLDAGVLARLGWGEEEAAIEALLEALVEAGTIPPFGAAELGLGAETLVAPAALPSGFRRVARYVGELLGVPEPAAVFRHPALGGDARLADVRPPALLVGPGLIGTTDAVELGFRVGRALALGTPGRVAGGSRTGRQLRPYLLAALSFARGMEPGEPEADRIAEQLGAAPGELTDQIAVRADRLARRRPSVNLTAWTHALSRTATRVGLLVSADLLRVGRAVADEEGATALHELLDFALSPEHFDLRDELGVSSVV